MALIGEGLVDFGQTTSADWMSFQVPVFARHHAIHPHR